MNHETEKFERQLMQIRESLDQHGWMLSAIFQHTCMDKEAPSHTFKELKLPGGERIFDNQDLCIMLRLSKRSLQRYRSLGLLPYIMLRQKTYYKESDVLQFLVRHLQDFQKRTSGSTKPVLNKQNNKL